MARWTKGLVGKSVILLTCQTFLFSGTGVAYSVDHLRPSNKVHRKTVASALWISTSPDARDGGKHQNGEARAQLDTLRTQLAHLPHVGDKTRHRVSSLVGQLLSPTNPADERSNRETLLLFATTLSESQYGEARAIGWEVSTKVEKKFARDGGDKPSDLTDITNLLNAANVREINQRIRLLEERESGPGVSEEEHDKIVNAIQRLIDKRYALVGQAGDGGKRFVASVGLRERIPVGFQAIRALLESP